MRFCDLLGVDLDKLGSVFVVDENISLAVHGGEFRLAAKREGAGDGAVRRVDASGVLSAPIKREHALAHWVVHNRVRIGVGLDGADGL